MREILFRAWDMLERKMIYQIAEKIDFRTDGHGLWMFYDLKNNKILIDHNAGILMQYADRMDKNKKKMFAGDILNSKNDGSDGCDIWGYETHCNLIVRWDEMLGCFDGLPDRGSSSVHSEQYIEVIGNLYEGKKL